MLIPKMGWLAIALIQLLAMSTVTKSQDVELHSRKQFLSLCKSDQHSQPFFHTLHAIKNQLEIFDCKLLYKNLSETKSLKLNNEQITDLSPLAFFPHLEELDLSSLSYFSNLKSLSGLNRLRTLDLSHTNITDLQYLTLFPHLKKLKLTATKITDTTPLKALFELKHLDLSYTNTESIDALINLKQLSSVKLEGTHVPRRDVRMLSEFLPHTMFAVGPKEPTKIDCQTALVGLEKISIRMNHPKIKRLDIKNISTFRNCPNSMKCFLGSVDKSNTPLKAYLTASHNQIKINAKKNGYSFNLTGRCREGFITFEGEFQISNPLKKLSSGKFFTVSNKRTNP